MKIWKKPEILDVISDFHGGPGCDSDGEGFEGFDDPIHDCFGSNCDATIDIDIPQF
jgi:hypothetical protein